MSKFLLHTFTRLVAHFRPQGRGGGDERESEPNCLVIWLFCYHHHKSRMKLIESKGVFFIFIRKRREKKTKNEKKKLVVLLASSSLNLGPFSFTSLFSNPSFLPARLLSCWGFLTLGLPMNASGREEKEFRLFFYILLYSC